MRFAGVGWRGGDFVGAVIDLDEPGPVTTTAFPYENSSVLAWLSEQRAGADGELIVATDSSSGVLEGVLLAAGVPVHRFDPWDVGSSRLHGSADPMTMAETARASDGLTLDALSAGWLTGRLDDLLDGYRSAGPAEVELGRLGRFIRRGPADRREVALTFDDGPDPRYTHQVLEILARYGVTATFFLVGLNARAHPQIVEMIASGGHVLGNHTWSHPMLPDLSEQNLARQVEATGEAIALVTGVAPRLVRPPYGGRNPTVLQQLTDLGMTTAIWDVDATDWARPGAECIEKTVLDNAVPGSIVLMHDSGGERDHTVAALPAIIEGLLADGFGLVSVDSMLQPQR